MPDRLDDLETRSAEEAFHGFLCWLPTAVGEVINTEAAAPSRAVLLATHQSPSIRRVRLTDAGRLAAGDVVDEEQLLDSVVGANDDSIIIPVIGASGTGKSHLVLWMQARLEEEASPNRKVIYVPKGDVSIASVIELILDGRTGGSFDDIRRSVTEASRGVTPEIAAVMLRDALAIAVTQTSDGADLPPEVRQMREYARTNLGALLRDEVYAQRLIGPAGALRRIVDQAMEGGRDDFSELGQDDLSISLTAVDQENLGGPARALLADLQSPEFLDATLQLLNEVRDQCLSEVFGVQPTQLMKVMMRLREELYAENPELELVLMIEDFTLLQGIQQDLLEAMMEPSRRAGAQVMCSMRTVMAVTRGFFERMLASNDTLRTRIASWGHVYSLDVAYGTKETGALNEGQVVDFVGRYLNAVRAGSGVLENAGRAIPNACDRCSHRDGCHSGFGATRDDGYGLYPLNDHAIDRMVRSRQDDFNPRDMLAALQRTLTIHAEELKDGRFPSARWAREFDPVARGRPPLPTLSLEVTRAVETLPKPVEREVLLTFWGGVPDALGNLEPQVHEAFGIQTIDGPIVGPGPDPGPGPGPGPDPGPDPTDDAITEALKLWRDGAARLGEKFSRDIRRMVGDAMIGALDAEGQLFSPAFVQRWFSRDRDVRIENAHGGSHAREGQFQVEIAASNDNALLFETVIRAGRTGTWAFEGGTTQLPIFLALISSEALRFREFLREKLEAEQTARDIAARLLVISGLALGRGGVSDTAGHVEAIVGQVSAVPESLPDRWRTLTNGLEDRRVKARDFLLEGAHVSKSTSEPAGIDTTTLRQALKPLRDGDWSVPEIPEGSPDAVSALASALTTRLGPALQEAHDVLRDWLLDVAPRVGDPETYAKRAKAIDKVVDEARGYWIERRPRDIDAPKANVIAATTLQITEVLEKWSEWNDGQRIAQVARLPWARMEGLRRYVLGLAVSLAESAQKAETQGAETADSEAVQSLIAALDELEAAAGTGGVR